MTLQSATFLLRMARCSLSTPVRWIDAHRSITWFALWSREAAFQNVSRCAKSAEISRHLVTLTGLELGLTAAELNPDRRHTH